MKRLKSLLLLSLLALSCVENPEPGEDDPVIEDPSLTLACTSIGSYSARFECSVGQTDRVFIGGGFFYSKMPDFSDAEKVPGIVISNNLACTVSDLEPDSRYYVKAYIFDVKGSLESSATSFDSPTFKVGKNSFRIGYQGDTIELDVETYTNFIVHTDVDWISGVDTRSGSAYFRTISIMPNTSLESRSAILTLESPDSFFKEKVEIYQEGSPVVIPDSRLKAWIVANYDTDGSNEIELLEIPRVDRIDITSDEVFSLEGLEVFYNLQSITCRGEVCGQLSQADLSGFPNLTTIDLSNNRLTSLDVSPCPQLKILNCSNNSIEYLDLSGNEPLEHLDCSGNALASLDLYGNYSLTSAKCDNNRLTSLRTPRSTALMMLAFNGNLVESIDLSNNRELKYLACSGNRLSTLNLSSNNVLHYLDCSSNSLKALSVRRNESLETLICADNGLVSLYLRYNTRLNTLDCKGNSIGTLDLSGNSLLESLDCGGNKLKTLDVSGLDHLADLKCNCEGMQTLLISARQSIEGITTYRNQLYINDATEVRRIEDLAYFADPVFKAYLVEYYDSDGDGELSRLEADTVTSLNIDTDNVGTLDGIEYLSGLKYLKCEGSSDGSGKTRGKLTSLDLSKNHYLEQVLCGRNRIETIDVSGCPELKTFWCYDNRLESIDVSSCTGLMDLNCEGNMIQNLDLSVNEKLVSLDCSPMAGDNGVNTLLEVHIGDIRIDYIYGTRRRRNVTNIPATTDLYVDNSLIPTLKVPFMFNYNAKSFLMEERAFYNSPGAKWEVDMTLNGDGFCCKDDYVQIEPGTFFQYHFSSPVNNPFNRRDNDDLTIIAKVKGNQPNQFSLFACRSSDSDYNYMFREDSEVPEYFYLHDSRNRDTATGLIVNSSPNIVIVRARRGKIWLESYTDGLMSQVNDVSWGGSSNAISLFYGGINDEYWSGDFYWMCLSLEALTDEEIKQVIDYNEN